MIDVSETMACINAMTRACGGHPPAELRMTPRDARELGTLVLAPTSGGRKLERFAGVPVVIDPEAPPLPRRDYRPKLHGRG